MARQKGVIKLQGQMGGVSFYKSQQDGFLAREKGGVDAEQNTTDDLREYSFGRYCKDCSARVYRCDSKLYNIHSTEMDCKRDPKKITKLRLKASVMEAFFSRTYLKTLYISAFLVCLINSSCFKIPSSDVAGKFCKNEMGTNNSNLQKLIPLE